MMSVGVRSATEEDRDYLPLLVDEASRAFRLVTEQ